jgi:uncharacterized protein YcfJ
MNKSLVIGLVAGVAATAGVGALGLALKGNNGTPETVVEAPLAAVDGAQPVAPVDEALTNEVEQPAAPPAVVVTPAPEIEKPVRQAPKFARVVSATPVSRSISEPREVCQDVEVTEQAPVKDKHQVAGTVIGGVIGGVIGNQIGDGDGRKIAKIAGALGGAYAGNKVQEKIQSSRTVTNIEKKCETVYESREVPNGYSVVYEWEGRTHTVHMDSDPGKRLPVRNGDVVLTASR